MCLEEGLTEQFWLRNRPLKVSPPFHSLLSVPADINNLQKAFAVYFPLRASVKDSSRKGGEGIPSELWPHLPH